MANSLFNTLGGNRPQANDPMSRFMRDFDEFRRNFKGDPKTEVERLIQSGQISQAQLDSLQTTARQLQNIFGLK